MADSKLQGDAIANTVSIASGDRFYIERDVLGTITPYNVDWDVLDAAIDTIITANADGFLLASNDLSDVASASTARVMAK